MREGKASNSLRVALKLALNLHQEENDEILRAFMYSEIAMIIIQLFVPHPREHYICVQWNHPCLLQLCCYLEGGKQDMLLLAAET